MSLPSRTFRASVGLLLAPAAFVLLLAACGADGESTVRTASGAPFCDEERDRFYQGEECDDCEVWSHRHVQQVVSTMPEELLRCDAPEDSCTAISFRESPCWNRGMWFGCTEVVVNAAQQDAFHAHDAEVAEQTCLSPGSTWQGCGETFGLKWTCGHFPEPACLQGVCVDTMNTDVPHVQRTGGAGATHDRLPARVLTDLACDPAERAQLSTCEWLATMDGLLVGELIHIRVVQRTRDETGEPLPDNTSVVRCEGEAVPALELELAPRMRFGAASNDNVTRVTVAPTDLMHWIPEAQVGDYWGGIPDGVQERAADDLHAGTGRLMPRSWRNRPGQTLVLPIVAGGEVGGERRYGLGGHPIGLLALDRAEGAEHRVLFQHSDACLEPYTFGDTFRDQAPDDFLDAVAACYASGLPDPPAEGIFLPEAPLPDAAFDSLCRDAR